MKLSRERDVEFPKDLERLVPPRLFLIIFDGELGVLIGKENGRQKVSSLLFFFSHSYTDCMTCCAQDNLLLFLLVFMTQMREMALAMSQRN